MEQGGRPVKAGGRANSDDESLTVGMMLNSVPEYRLAQAWIGQLWPTAGDALRETLRNVAPRLFGAVLEHCRRAFDRNLDVRVRRKALSRLQEALRHLTPQGRPPHITDMDVAARDWPTIRNMHAQFLALARRVSGGQLDSESAEAAVNYIRETFVGDKSALEEVKVFAPLFIRKALALNPVEWERMLDGLARIKRPRSQVGFATAVLTAKYNTGPRTVQRIIRRMRQPVRKRPLPR
jgi:hypothetical protein